ncbi:ROK family protein [Dongia sp.]|uniref:ROK family transcriptional regulator n=1 Tax=Dongia sp. TaxID=1977262 RepID=UPI0035AE3603
MKSKRTIVATAGTNLGGASAHNRRVVFDALRLNGALSRADIARATQLTPQTVSNIIDQFAQDGLVAADEPLRGARGQPATPYRILPGGAWSIGVEIDRHRVLGVGVDLAGTTLSRRHCRLLSGGPQMGLPVVLDLIADIERDLKDVAKNRKSRAVPLLGLGIAMPGPFGTGNDTVPADPLLDPWVMREWHSFPLMEKLSDATGLEARLQNDASAAAIAEKMYGVARGLDNFVYLFLGYGLGAGIVIQGEIYAGMAGNAGEIGQLPASALGASSPPRSLEEYVSILSLCRATGLDAASGDLFEEMQRLCGEGDRKLQKWAQQAGQHLRQAVQIVEALFDPQTVVLGGQVPGPLLAEIARHIDPLLPSVSARHDRSRARLTLGSADMWAVAQGAAMEPIARTFDPQFRAIFKSIE